MAFVLYDRVRVSSSTTGTGTLTLGSAATGCRTFASVYSDADTMHYVIQDGANWEVGLGEYGTASNVLARNTVFASSNAGSKINCSGNQSVWVDCSAQFLNRLKIDAGGWIGTVGAYALQITLTGNSGVTMPISGTLLSTDDLGTDVLTALAVNVGSAGAFVTNNAANTFTATQTISQASLILSGNISAPAWTTSGIRYKNATATLTDTTSSGTVATAYTNVWGGNTIAASSATTFTNYFNSYFNAPTAGPNVTLTNPWAVGADSLKVGTSNSFTVSASGVVTIGSSTGVLRVDSGTVSVVTNFAYRLKDAMALGGTNRTVSGATNASPIEITTTAGHGYSTGETVTVASVGGNTAANGTWTIVKTSSTKFTLTGSTGNGTYTSGGTVTPSPTTATTIQDGTTSWTASLAAGKSYRIIADGVYVAATGYTITLLDSGGLTATGLSWYVVDFTDLASAIAPITANTTFTSWSNGVAGVAGVFRIVIDVTVGNAGSLSIQFSGQAGAVTLSAGSMDVEQAAN